MNSDRPTVELCTGLPASGKTTWLLERYRQVAKDCAARQQPVLAIWLTPTTSSRRAILERLTDSSTPVLFGARVYTFEQFAEQVLRTNRVSDRALASTARRLLIRKAIAGLHAAGRLPHYGKIAHTAGLISLVDQWIAELKQEEIWPEDFAAACAYDPHRADWQELSLIYQRYQEWLNWQNWYDFEGRFWRARQLLESGAKLPVSPLELVVVDGFTDFTPSQYSILKSLLQASGRMFISLPDAPDDDRDEVFSRVRQTASRLKQELGPMARWKHHHHELETSSWQPGLASLASSLLRNQRSFLPHTDAAGLEVVACLGPESEREAILARIKTVLASGVSPVNIALVSRDLEASGATWQRELSEAGIPCRFDVGAPLLTRPIIKALLSFLRLERDDWSFIALQAVLGNSLFSPVELSGVQFRRRVLAALRKLDLDASRAETLAVLRNESRSGSDASLIDEGLRALERLDRWCEPLRHEQSLLDWADTIAVLADHLGWLRSVTGTLLGTNNSHPSDQADWQQLQRVLRDAAAAEAALALPPANINTSSVPRSDERIEALTAVSPVPVRLLGISQFMDELRDLLQRETVPQVSPQGGCVWLCRPEDIRHTRVDYLFLVNLGENSFPRSSHEQGLVSDADRERLRTQGVAVSLAGETRQGELFLFYRTLLAARRQVVLSYADVNEGGQRVFPSPYLTAVRQLFAPGVLLESREGQLDPLPAANRLMSQTTTRLGAAQRALNGDPQLLRSLFEAPLLRASMRSFLSAVFTAAHRFETRGLTHYEGVVDKPENLTRLQRRYAKSRQFSATELEKFATCPFRFWVENVVQARSAVTPLLGTDVRTRGTIVHAVLANMADVQQPRELLQTSYQQHLSAQLQAQRRPTRLHRALGNIETELLEDLGPEFVDQAIDYVQALRTVSSDSWRTLTELSFGKAGHDESVLRDTPTSVGITTPLNLGAADNPVLVAGRIDRIDLCEIEGEPRYIVVDYKTGTPPSFSLKSLAAGTMLQLAIYLVAVHRLQLAGPGCRPLQAGYWALFKQGFKPILGGKGKRAASAAAFERLNDEQFDQLTSTLDHLVPQLVSGIRSGQFTVTSTDRECTSICPVKMVCRVNEVRSVAAHLGKIGLNQNLSELTTESAADPEIGNQ